MKPLGISLITGGMILLIIATINLLTGGIVNPGMVEVLNVEFDPRTWSAFLGAAMLVAGVVVLVTSATDEKTPAKF